MGILYQASMSLKRQHIIQELLNKGITENKEGVSVYDLSYDDLKYELVLAAFREIDAENGESRWF